jgi:hypothetical protein
VPHKPRTLGKPHADKDLARLHERFRAVSRRRERALALRRFSRAAMILALITIGIAVLCWGLTA